MAKKNQKPATEAIKKSLKIIGDRWTILIVNELLTGKKRFGELLKALPGISPRTLSARLIKLEKEKILNKKTYSEIPPKTEYRLSKKGLDFRPILKQVAKWGLKHQNQQSYFK